MSLCWMVFRSLRQHALSSVITASSIALASGLLMSVWVLKTQSREALTRFDAGFDAVLGARSSKLQLVLNAIFHLEASPANIAWQDYLDLQKNRNVELAVPIAMGDNYRGYRIVGTLPEMFTKTSYAPGRHYSVQKPGRLFDPTLREAVVGSFTAAKLGLKIGDKFRPYHGLNFDEEHQHDETYVIVGVLEPSSTPADRVIWIPLEGVQQMTGHAEATATELSAVLVKLPNPLAGRALELQYNRQGHRLTFAWPIGATMAELLNKFAWFERVLALVAALVALVATGSVLASIYNSMNERRRQIAIFRALGARRTTVASTVVLESLAISAAGAVVGFAVYFVIMTGAARLIRAETGVVLEPLAWHPVFVWAPLTLCALGSLAGWVPAWKAYRTDVAKNLVPPG